MRWRKIRMAPKIQLNHYRVELGCRSPLLRKPRRRDTDAEKRQRVNHGLIFLKLRERFRRGRDPLQLLRLSKPQWRLDRRLDQGSVPPHVARLKEVFHY